MSGSDKKRPWMKWYPADWRGDPRLRMCSLSARGLWADIISYMHEGEPYGHLTIDGKAPDTKEIASLVARPVAEVRVALAELERRNVFSRSEAGVIVSRRMVRDNVKATRDHLNGKGGGNPRLRDPVNGEVNPPDKAQIPEARSQKDGGGGDAREPLVSEAAFSLSAEIGVIAGHREPVDWPPGWCGAPMRVQAWLNEGWQREVILVAVREAMGKKRDGPPDTVNYFEKAVARAVARHSAPLPKVISSSPEVIHVQADQRHPGGAYGASKDRFREAHAALDASIAADEAGEEGGEPFVEILPPARCG